MAKKKNEKKKENSFQNSPFKDLKGLRVSGESGEKKRPKSEETSAPCDDTSVFAEEMANLGVKRREGASIERPVQSSERPVDGKEIDGEKNTSKSDEELFLGALGQMDAVFEDEIPEPDEPKTSPNRMRLLKKGKLFPEAKLDLHGLNRDEAREKVRYFLEDAVYQGKKTVLIVTGRGNGSNGEPVLRAEIERYLSLDAKKQLSEWGRAPRQYGGEGALVVFLKGPGK